jgi:hypothetical protein
MFEELDTRNAEMMMKLQGSCTLIYPSMLTSKLPDEGKWSTLDVLVPRGCSMMCWRLGSRWLRRFSMQECGGSETLMWSIDSVWTWILLEEEFMAYRFCGSQKWNVSVRYPFHS